MILRGRGLKVAAEFSAERNFASKCETSPPVTG
nr:MAG TPA: hypothetical protein [Caudoviricetes sp.]